MLTTENESELKAGILLEDLPKSFVEAIKIARRLDIHYM